MPRTSWSTNQKLTGDQISSIASSTERTCILAEQYGVTISTIKRHRPGRAHIKFPRRSRLSIEEIAAIKASDESGTILADRYGMSIPSISRIRRGYNTKQDAKPAMTDSIADRRRKERKAVIAEKRAQLLREIAGIQWRASA